MPKGERTVVELRAEARRHGVSGAWKMRKSELLEALGGDDNGRNVHSGRGDEGRRNIDSGPNVDSGRGDGRNEHSEATDDGVRLGREISPSVPQSQPVSSLDEQERAGRSLVTTNHDVIRQWAESRQARPATVGERESERPRVLRFLFDPVDEDSSRLVEISWDMWFEAFDQRALNFLFQEHRTDGRDSNFFRLENPEREDA
jgi:hypothetical protein